MRFKDWLTLSEEYGVVTNVIDKGLDGTYLKFQDGSKMGPVASMQPADTSGEKWVAHKKGGNPVGIVVVASPQFAKVVQQKVLAQQQHNIKSRQGGIDPEKLKRLGKGIVLYRGIGGQYDPSFSRSHEQYFSPDIMFAWDYAVKRSGPGQRPNIVRAAFPGSLFSVDPHEADPNKIKMHGSGGSNIFDVPNSVLHLGYPEQLTHQQVDGLIKRAGASGIWGLNDQEMAAVQGYYPQPSGIPFRSAAPGTRS